MADPPQHDSKLLGSLLANTNSNNEAQKDIDTRYPHCTSYSGFSLCACVYTINVVCFLFVMLISKTGTTSPNYGSEKRQLLVTYFRKLSLMELLSGTVATATAFWLNKVVALDEDVGTASFNVLDLNYLVIFTIFLTIAICVIRYMSFGIANSDTYNLQQQQLPVSQKRIGSTKKHVPPQNDGFFKDKHTKAFVVSLQTYIGYAVVMGVVVSVFLFGFSPSENKEPLINIELCIPNELMRSKNRGILAGIIVLSMNLCCLVSETVFESKRKDIFGASVSSSYFSTTVFSTNCGWLVVVCIMYFILDFYPLQFMIMWEIFCALDATWILIFLATTIVSNKTFNV